jgi:prepilin-type N-terminal cleavage/methylation domain-containing protein
MKKSMFDKKQKGFTLLELLVVITLLAILSVGALVAYEGIGDTAQATAAASNTARVDSAIRNYKAVTQSYPDQWDNLVTNAGAAMTWFSADTYAHLANFALPATAAIGDFRDVLDTRMNDLGIDEIQQRTIVGLTPNVEPNLQHNEGATANNGDAVESLFTAMTNIAVLPSYREAAAAACSIAGAAFVNRLDGVAVDAADANHQNVINDAMDSDTCQFVIALGFGHDAAHSTNGSSVAISTAPTFVSKDINPATSYARYIALFRMGEDGANGGTVNNDVTVDELFANPRLIAVVDTEGRVIDENIAGANAQQ